MAKQKEHETTVTVTDLTPPAPTSKTPRQDQPKGSGDGATSYPLSHRDDSRHGEHEAMLREKWKEQGRVKCAHKKCHYPLNLVKNKDNEVIAMTVPDGDAFEAVCSWDPSHLHPEGGPQFILLEQLKANEEKEEK